MLSNHVDLKGISNTSNITYLLFLAVLALDAVVHAHLAHELLSQEVSDLDEGAALRDGAVDGEMGVDGAHLVLVALN